MSACPLFPSISVYLSLGVSSCNGGNLLEFFGFY